MFNINAEFPCIQHYNTDTVLQQCSCYTELGIHCKYLMTSIKDIITLHPNK